MSTQNQHQPVERSKPEQSAQGNEGVPLLSTHAKVATIRLNRPSQHNRLDPIDLPVLMQFIDQIESSSEIELLVITGTGSKSFCSGYTLQAIVGQLDEAFENTLQRIEDCVVPTLCALNGSAYGGGTDLALCCDFRIGMAQMKAFMPAAQFGLHYHPAGMRRYIQNMGLTAAKKMLLTGQTFTDDQLLECGFLTELVSDSTNLQDRVQSYANALSLCDAPAVRSMKAHMKAIASNHLGATTDRSKYLSTLGSERVKQRLHATISKV